MNKRALIAGVSGQDGSYLAELLINKGYEVIGMARKNSLNTVTEINQVFNGDISDSKFVLDLIDELRPVEIYNLASQSSPADSWNSVAETMAVNGLGAVNIFNAVRIIEPTIKIFHASSSEIFGKVNLPANEDMQFNPQNPYAASKVYAHNMARIYRESYGLKISCGILFNHESERRPLHFLTQKIAYGAACAALGIDLSPEMNELGNPIVENGYLTLGNMNVSRDWGYAPDFVEAMWLALQQDKFQDFIIGTGRTNTIQDLCGYAYGSVGLDWRDRIVGSPDLERPLDFHVAVANPSKARNILGWEAKMKFEDMVARMVRHQITRLESTKGN